MKNVQTKVTNAEYEKLKELASKKGLTVYQLLRRIIQEYLAKESDKDDSDLPIEVRLRKLELQYQELRRKLSELIEKINKQGTGLTTWMKRK